MMPRYKRTQQPGGTYFFTIVLADRKSSLLIDQFKLLSSVTNQVKRKYPFRMRAWVVLPEHLHMIWTLPECDANYMQRIWSIKTAFSKQHQQQSQKTDIKIWQNRYWEHVIRNQTDLNNHINYIHFNPVKHGYVSKPIEWRYSSFHHYLARGIYMDNWGSIGPLPIEIDAGE